MYRHCARFFIYVLQSILGGRYYLPSSWVRDPGLRKGKEVPCRRMHSWKEPRLISDLALVTSKPVCGSHIRDLRRALAGAQGGGDPGPIGE